MERLKKFGGIIFGYEINILSYHNNLVYAVTLSGSQRVMRWRLILGEFGPNIQHIAGVENIVADTLSRFPSTSSKNYDPFTRKVQCCANELSTIFRVENSEDCFPINI